MNESRWSRDRAGKFNEDVENNAELSNILDYV